MNELTQLVGRILATTRAGEGAASGPEWELLDRAGMTRVGIPENLGGAGGNRAEAALVITACAEQAASMPLTEAMLIGGLAADLTGRPVPAGMVTAALGGGAGRLRAAWEPGGWRVSGTARRVPWARDAAFVLAVCRANDSRVVLAWVADDGFAVDRGSNMAGEPRDDIRLVDHRPAEADVCPQEAADDLAAIAAFGRTCEMLGALRASLRLTIGHARLREQFGRPIARNQAVAHAIAELAGEVAATEACTAAAIDLIGQSSTITGATHLAIAMAKVQAARAATRVADLAHQVHGAIGMTAEYPLHLHTTRLWAWRDEYGTERWWCGWIGRHAPDHDGLWPDL